MSNTTNQKYYNAITKCWDINNKEEWIKQEKLASCLRTREYYKENRDRILGERREKIVCECGKTISKNSLWFHKKTKYHLENVLGKEPWFEKVSNETVGKEASR
jgi:hypothetical protein